MNPPAAAAERRRASCRHTAAPERIPHLQHHFRALFSNVRRARPLVPRPRPRLQPDKAVRRKHEAHSIAAAACVQSRIGFSHRYALNWGVAARILTRVNRNSSGKAASRDGR